jgi:hypothetical protein
MGYGALCCSQVADACVLLARSYEPAPLSSTAPSTASSSTSSSARSSSAGAGAGAGGGAAESGGGDLARAIGYYERALALWVRLEPGGACGVRVMRLRRQLAALCVATDQLDKAVSDQLSLSLIICHVLQCVTWGVWRVACGVRCGLKGASIASTITRPIANCLRPTVLFGPATTTSTGRGRGGGWRGQWCGAGSVHHGLRQNAAAIG